MTEILRAENSFHLLNESIQEALKRQGIVDLTRIQDLAIPQILRGENVLLIAPTGTGKTLAAIVPIFHRFTEGREAAKGISIVYVTPLRALNRDLLRRLMDMGRQLEIDIQVRHGDTVQSVRTNQARKPPDMLITTPETLQAILPGTRMKHHLKHVRWVVIDEIHELATDKRGTQLALALERLRELTQREFQRIGLSATIGEPGKIASFLAGSGRKSIVVKTDEAKEASIKVEYPAADGRDLEEGRRLGLSPSSIARLRKIVELVQKTSSSLVFTNTREHAEALGSQIKILYPGLPVGVHHGSLSKDVREEVEAEFQAGRIRSIICTSSLELGVDIGNVSHVIQYMSPRQATKLIHRIGRSGHKVGETPRGSIITNSADDILEAAVLSRRAKNGELEPLRTHDMALDVLGHQLIGAIMDNRNSTPDDLLRMIRRAYLYRDISPDQLASVLRQLEAQRLIRMDGIQIRLLSSRAFNYYFENLSMIPDVKQYTVFDFFRRKRIGTLDQEFVARRCKSGVEFIMHGQTWKIITVSDDKLNIEVEPTTPTLNAIPSWEGEIIPVEFDVATEVGSLRRKLSLEDSSKELQGYDLIDEGGLRRAYETIHAHAKNYPLPSDTTILVERFEHCLVLHACFGNLVNEALAIVFSAILAARYGVTVATQTDAYRIALTSSFRLDPHVLANELRKMKVDDLDGILQNVIEGTELFLWKQWHVAKRFGAIERRVDYNPSRARLIARIFRESPICLEAKREVFLDKLDLGNAQEVIRSISNGEITVQVVDQKGENCSPLATPILDKILPNDLLRPAIPTRPIVDIVRERLESQAVRLVCIFNADWQGIRSLRTLPDRFACPKCRSTLIAVTYRNDEGLLKVARKKKRQQKLSQAEQLAWMRGWVSASLVQNSGRKAAVAMAARGVGPITARRLLRKHYRSEDEFFVEIVKAEREYARTRLFWD